MTGKSIFFTAALLLLGITSSFSMTPEEAAKTLGLKDFKVERDCSNNTVGTALSVKLKEKVQNASTASKILSDKCDAYYKAQKQKMYTEAKELLDAVKVYIKKNKINLTDLGSRYTKKNLETNANTKKLYNDYKSHYEDFAKTYKNYLYDKKGDLTDKTLEDKYILLKNKMAKEMSKSKPNWTPDEMAENLHYILIREMGKLVTK